MVLTTRGHEEIVIQKRRPHVVFQVGTDADIVEPGLSTVRVRESKVITGMHAAEGARKERPVYPQQAMPQKPVVTFLACASSPYG